FSQQEAYRQLCSRIECVKATSRADVEQKVRDGEVLGGLILPPDFLTKLQAELGTNASEPATVDVLINQDDPIKARLGRDPISAPLSEANLKLSDRVTQVAASYQKILAKGGDFQIPFIGTTVHVLGLDKTEQIMKEVAAKLPPGELRTQVQEIA